MTILCFLHSSESPMQYLVSATVFTGMALSLSSKLNFLICLRFCKARGRAGVGRASTTTGSRPGHGCTVPVSEGGVSPRVSCLPGQLTLSMVGLPLGRAFPPLLHACKVRSLCLTRFQLSSKIIWSL